MKKLLPIFMLSFLLVSCGGDLDNQITFNNNSAGDIQINFRAEIIDVQAGSETVIKNITPGTYSYSTTYQVPSSATSSNEVGDVSGSVTVRAGTRITILYSSTLFGGIYTIYATKSSSDDESLNNGNNP